MEKLIEYKEMREAISRVRELHKPATISEGSIHTRYCTECAKSISDADDFIQYPCPTIKALDGEQ